MLDSYVRYLMFRSSEDPEAPGRTGRTHCSPFWIAAFFCWCYFV